MTTSFQVGLILIALGCLPGGLGWLIFFNRLRFLRSAVKTTGLVEKITLLHLTEGHAYQPTITFTTSDEQKITLTSLGLSNPSLFQAGQQVPLIYDPQKPTRARIRAFTSLWFATLLFLGLGLLLFLPGLALLFFNQN